jgi:transcriptional regulator with XRE-family HTH domain
VTETKDLKRLVRDRMRAHGEPYMVARRRVLGSAKALVTPELAEVMAAARAERGWTLAEAARRLGVSALKVGLLEHAQATVDRTLIEVLTATYGLDERIRRRLLLLADAHDEAQRGGRPRSGPLASWASEPVLWVATRGRRTGVWRPKWWVTFVVDGDSVWLFEIEGERADWVRNVGADPQVHLWVRNGAPRPAIATVVTAESDWARARRLLLAKHADHRDLADWGVAVRVRVAEGVEA